MSSCLDSDTLASIGQALEWDIEEPLRHLLECDTCRESVAILAGAQRVLAQEAPADPALVDRIMNTMTEPVAAATGQPRAATAVWLLNGGMAALTVLAVAGAATLQTGGPPPGWAAVGGAVATAGFYLLRERRVRSAN